PGDAKRFTAGAAASPALAGLAHHAGAVGVAAAFAARDAGGPRGAEGGGARAAAAPRGAGLADDRAAVILVAAPARADAGGAGGADCVGAEATALTRLAL